MEVILRGLKLYRRVFVMSTCQTEVPKTDEVSWDKCVLFLPADEIFSLTSVMYYSHIHDWRRIFYIDSQREENIPSYVCARWRLESACASAQSDQSLRCPYEETLWHWPSKMHIAMVLTRLCECAGWSESSMGATVHFFDVVANIIYELTSLY